MEEQKMDISLPKLVLETTVALRENLTSLGLGSLFSQDDDSDIIAGNRQDVTLSRVEHKARFAFTEDGTTGTKSAVTRVSDQHSLTWNPTVTHFLVDHPFIFYVVDHTEDLLLFLGDVEAI